MRRLLAVLLTVFLFAGCGSEENGINRAMSLREQLLKSNGYVFDAVITADYGEKVYTFSLYCHVNSKGDIAFTVKDPQTISGITGTIGQQGGNLTFDDRVLAFEMLADGQVTPVSAPWLLICALRSGYIASCGEDSSGLRIMIDDSYEEDALQLDIWLDGNDLPIRGEILWKGRRILSVEVRNFSYV